MWTERIAEAVSTDIAGAVEHLDGPASTDAFFAAQAENLDNYSAALAAAAEALSEKHIHQAVIEAFRELAASVSSVTDQAREMYGTHRAEHDPFVE